MVSARTDLLQTRRRNLAQSNYRFPPRGGGHRSTAEASSSLSPRKSIHGRQAPRHSGIARSAGPDSPRHRPAHTGTYNAILRKGWTRFTPQLLVLLKATIRVRHSAIVTLLRNHWRSTDGLGAFRDPHFNREIAESLQPWEMSGTKTPFVTLITDLAITRPFLDRAGVGVHHRRDGSRSTTGPGHRSSNRSCFPDIGMILKPKFYETTIVDRVAERKQLGLEPDCPTASCYSEGMGRSDDRHHEKLNESAAACS